MLPSYFYLQLSYFQNFSSIMFNFLHHIFHIFHWLGRFFDSFFPMSALPASPRYFFQSVSSFLSCPSDITFYQFVASYFIRIFFDRCHFPSFSLFLTVSLHFSIWCHLLRSCHVHQLSNSKFSPCMFFLCFSFLSFHSSFPSSPNFHTVSQYSAFPSKFSLSRILV